VNAEEVGRLVLSGMENTEEVGEWDAGDDSG
jgi:hypothetical protein